MCTELYGNCTRTNLDWFPYWFSTHQFCFLTDWGRIGPPHFRHESWLFYSLQNEANNGLGRGRKSRQTDVPSFGAGRVELRREEGLAGWDWVHAHNFYCKHFEIVHRETKCMSRKKRLIKTKTISIRVFFLSSSWPTRDHIGRSTRNSNPVMTSSTGGAKGCLDHRFRAPQAHLLTLHQHRANNQYRTANQLSSTLRVSSNTQAALEQSPIQVLTELNIAGLQWSYENWYFQVDKSLGPSIGAFSV